jgi:hypothetical protein
MGGSGENNGIWESFNFQFKPNKTFICCSWIRKVRNGSIKNRRISNVGLKDYMLAI